MAKPKKEDEALKATHFIASHAVGPFAKGQLVTADELNATLGIEKGASPEDAEKTRTAGVKRLLSLGAIVPTEAPEEPEEEEQPAPQAAQSREPAKGSELPSEMQPPRPGDAKRPR